MQPEFVVLLEIGKLLCIPVPASEVCLPQKVPAAIGELSVVYFPAVAEVHLVTFFLCKQTLRDQVLKADQIRVSRESRKGLIR